MIDDDNNLPEGWASSPLCDLVEMKYGKGLVQERRRLGDIPVYGSNGIVGQHDQAVTAGPTIVVGRKGSVGEVHVSAMGCWPIDTTYFIDDFGPFDCLYLAHALRALRLGELDRSTAIPGLSREQVYGIEIPVPPLAEQKRIVAKVEALVARVNAARERLAKVPAILKRFRQSVLAAACSGQLTADWREENRVVAGAAKNDLLSVKKHLDAQVLKGGRIESTEGHETITDGLPPCWQAPRLHELFTFIDYRGKNPKKSDHGRRLITAKNIRMGFLSDDPVDYVSVDTYNRWMTRGFPRKGDLLFVTEGATMGFVAANDRDDEFALAQRTLTLQPVSQFSTKIFLYFIMSRNFQDLVKINATGSAAVGIKAARFRDLPIPFPSFAEQHEIVRCVEALFALADKIEAAVQTAAARVEKITQAILAKAFRGELVPTESELARQEAREYEPAGVLLAHIQAARVAEGNNVRQQTRRKQRRKNIG